MKNYDNYIEFPIPDGMDLEGMEEGEEREVVAVIRKKEGATACLISVYGIPILKEEPEEEIEEEVVEEPAPQEPAPVDYAARARQSLE